MRQLITAMFLLILSGGSIHAQLFAEADVAFLSPLAINQNVYGFSEMEYSFRGGVQAGLGVGYALGPSHNITLHARYSAQGGNYGSVFDGVEHERDVSLNYVQIPLQYRLVGAGDSNVKFSLSIGPYIAFLLSADQTWRIDGSEVDMLSFHASQGRNARIGEVLLLMDGKSNPSDYADLFENMDVGLTGSLGAHIDLNDFLFLQTELFAGMGFMDINAESWRIPNSQNVYEKTTNLFGGVRVGLGILFGE